VFALLTIPEPYANTDPDDVSRSFVVAGAVLNVPVGAVAAVTTGTAIAPLCTAKLFTFAFHDPSTPTYLIAPVSVNGSDATTTPFTDAVATWFTGS
jgi:hypothetical protein